MDLIKTKNYMQTSYSELEIYLGNLQRIIFRQFFLLFDFSLDQFYIVYIVVSVDSFVLAIIKANAIDIYPI